METQDRANHVTQTKTLPGPSAGWVTCWSSPGPIVPAVFKKNILFVVKTQPLYYVFDLCDHKTVSQLLSDAFRFG